MRGPNPYRRSTDTPALSIAEPVAKRRSQASLHDAYRALAREMAALLPELDRLQTEMTAIWQVSEAMFPNALLFGERLPDGRIVSREFKPHGDLPNLHHGLIGLPAPRRRRLAAFVEAPAGTGTAG